MKHVGRPRPRVFQSKGSQIQVAYVHIAWNTEYLNCFES